MFIPRNHYFFLSSSRFRYKFANYSEFWSFYVNRVHPHVPFLMTPRYSPHNREQNMHVKIFNHFRILWLFTLQRVLKPYWTRADLIGLHSVGVHPQRL